MNIATAQVEKEKNKDWILMKNPKLVLGKIVRFYKARTSKIIHDSGFSHFRWQSNYYEHIVRNNYSFNKIRNYIKNNALNHLKHSQ